MILLREALDTDVDGLEELSQIAAEKHPGFLNISADRDQWREKIKLSKLSFSDKIRNKKDAKFLFVAEDLEKKKIVGISMIAAQHGSEESPHFFFEVSNEKKFSETINTGFIHGTLNLKTDSNGPTEIGGLLVNPEFRNNDVKIGRQISFIRFLYIAIHRSRFKNRVLAELLPPLTKRGKSPLWEAIGRRFTNMDYTEADVLSAKNKEFIFSLFPEGKIYVTFLPAEARNAIGKVSKDTEPVMHMLKRIGFKYESQVDPFDGGPHLQANTDDIIPIQNLKTYSYGGSASPNEAVEVSGIVTSKQKTATFTAVSVEAKISENKIFFDEACAALVSLKSGESVFFIPYY